jgi:hypothetical protein
MLHLGRRGGWAKNKGKAKSKTAAAEDEAGSSDKPKLFVFFMGTVR